MRQAHRQAHAIHPRHGLYKAGWLSVVGRPATWPLLMTLRLKRGQPTCSDVNATSRGPPTAPRMADSESTTARARCMPAAGATLI